ncbi:MAG: hypothetical protein DRO93_02225 [Candidatus Thorarchaeota archaeon]|nr:MAG: hypothetical protein DRO93_02225 [Candidatus Thorarchaeota archaeon]
MRGSILTPEMRHRILAQIVPEREEISRQQRVVKRLTKALSEVAEEIGQSFVFIEPQGSTGAKQTQLRGASDIDLFVGLSPREFSDILQQSAPQRQAMLSERFDELVDRWFWPAAQRAGGRNIIKAYSQHPYLSLVVEDIDVDVIACFYLSPEELAENGPITAVDRTIHHTRFVLDRINDTLRNDIRILKSFVRASHAYGDDCAVGQMGLTGYSLELITLFGNGIDGAVEMLLHIEDGPIDPFGRPAHVLRRVPTFRDDHVILIDPTDANRNVASSFSPRAVRWTITRLRHLIELRERGEDDAVVDLVLERPIPTDPPPSWLAPHCITRQFVGARRVHYTLFRDKLHRLCRLIARVLRKENTGEKRFGETLWEVYFEQDHYAIGMIVEKPVIEPVYSRRGPPVDIEKAASAFRKKHPTAYEKDGYLWLDTKRRWTRAGDMIDYMIERHSIEGLEMTTEEGDVSRRVLNTLYRYVMRIEDFPLSRRQEYKDTEQTLGW